METTKQVKLQIDNISISFGGARALLDVSLDIREKEILAIIGPNGAGKTCIFNCIIFFISLRRVKSTMKVKGLLE